MHWQVIKPIEYQKTQVLSLVCSRCFLNSRSDSGRTWLNFLLFLSLFADQLRRVYSVIQCRPNSVKEAITLQIKLKFDETFLFCAQSRSYSHLFEFYWSLSNKSPEYSHIFDD